jgi:hypothetical protein
MLSAEQFRSKAMKNLYDPADAGEIRQRLAALRPDSERQWGKMNSAQMLAHCAISMEWATGDRIPGPAPLAIRFLGRMIKPLALGSAPMRRNSPTAKELVIPDGRDFVAERARLVTLIDRFAAAGPGRCTSHPHSFFGRMTPPEWANLMYKHLDHHLRQFGV